MGEYVVCGADRMMSAMTHGVVSAAVMTAGTTLQFPAIQRSELATCQFKFTNPE